MFKHYENGYNWENDNAVVAYADNFVCDNSHFCKGRIDR